MSIYLQTSFFSEVLEGCSSEPMTLPLNCATSSNPLSFKGGCHMVGRVLYQLVPCLQSDSHCGNGWMENLEPLTMSQSAHDSAHPVWVWHDHAHSMWAWNSSCIAPRVVVSYIQQHTL